MTSSTSRYRVDELLHQFDAALSTGSWHSLLGNLRDVPTEAWVWAPDRGTRNVQQMVGHLGMAARMYGNHAFGDGSYDWDVLDPDIGEAFATTGGAIAWLEESCLAFRTHVAGLDDEDLDQDVDAPWPGERRPARWIITTMIHHLLYHSGEVNHLRALYLQADEWGLEGDDQRGCP